jgi:hypothetical protein
MQHDLRRKLPAGGRQARFGVIPLSPVPAPVVKIPFAERRAFSPAPAYPVDPVAPKAVLFLDDEQSYVELMAQLLSDNLLTLHPRLGAAHEALAVLAASMWP